MEFPFNISFSQAPDDVFSLLNNLIASGTANTDEIENADFSGLPSESSVPCFPTRHANAQQPSLVNGEIIGRESQVWNPYSTLPPLSICPSAPMTEEPPLSICPSALTTEEPPSDDVAPQSSTVPATEDENYALDLELFLMPDLGPTYDVFNPYSDQLPLHIGDSNERSNEIFGGVWENHFVDVGPMSYFYNLYSDLLPLPIGQFDERPSEIVSSVSENHYMVGQSQQIDYPSGLTTDKPSSEAIASTNSTVLADENGQSTSICQPILPSDWQMMASRLAFPAVEFPSSTSYCPLGLEFRHNDIVHSGPFDGSSPSIGKLEEYNFMEDLERILKNRGEPHENLNFRYQEVGQSQQIDYPSGLTTDKPSSEAIASANSTVLAVENGQSTSICQPILPSDWQMMASPLAFPALGFPSSTSYCPLGLGFRQNDIVHSGPFDGSSPSIGKLEEYNFMDDLERILKNRGEPHENLNFRYQEVDRGKKKKKLNDGRRRCSCTKSKCIQLYCECFSSGSFCDETCGCKGCFNRSEQETLVLNKRTEIEKRNSLAFAPKIEPLHQEDSELSNRKRQKRGCSCTKSKCLQKYCECYQANVKCSVACRCKGCGNRDTHEHNAGLENFMIGESMNNNVDTHGFYRNGGEMLPQTEANNNSIGRQSRLSSISSVLPLEQWTPRESTSYSNSLSSYPTFGPRPLPLMNFYEVPANHNGTPLVLNDSRLPVRVNSPYRNRVPQPWFPGPEAVHLLRRPLSPPMTLTEEATAGDDEKSKV